MSSRPWIRVTKSSTCPETVSLLLLIEKVPFGPGTCSSNGVDVDESRENWSARSVPLLVGRSTMPSKCRLDWLSLAVICLDGTLLTGGCPGGTASLCAPGAGGLAGAGDDGAQVGIGLGPGFVGVGVAAAAGAAGAAGAPSGLGAEFGGVPSNPPGGPQRAGSGAPPPPAPARAGRASGPPRGRAGPAGARGAAGWAPRHRPARHGRSRAACRGRTRRG